MTRERDVPRCDVKVPEPPHYFHEHTCDRRATFVVIGLHGPRTVCGTHRRMLLNHGFQDAPKATP